MQTSNCGRPHKVLSSFYFFLCILEHKIMQVQTAWWSPGTITYMHFLKFQHINTKSVVFKGIYILKVSAQLFLRFQQHVLVILIVTQFQSSPGTQTRIHSSKWSFSVKTNILQGSKNYFQTLEYIPVIQQQVVLHGWPFHKHQNNEINNCGVQFVMLSFQTPSSPS